MSSRGLFTPNPRTGTSRGATCAPGSSARLCRKPKRANPITVSSGIPRWPSPRTTTRPSITAETISSSRPIAETAGRLEEIVSAVIDGRVVVRGDGHRGIPLETVMGFARFGFRHNRALLPGAHVAPRDVPVLGFGVNNPRLDIVDRRVKTVAAVNHLPIFIHNAFAG